MLVAQQGGQVTGETKEGGAPTAVNIAVKRAPTAVNIAKLVIVALQRKKVCDALLELL